MMMSDDKVGGWVKKGQNHDDVILECPLSILPDPRKIPKTILGYLPAFFPTTIMLRAECIRKKV